MIVEVDCRGLSLVVSAVGKFWCEVGVDGTVFMAWQRGCCPICYESRDISYILYDTALTLIHFRFNFYYSLTLSAISLLLCKVRVETRRV